MSRRLPLCARCGAPLRGAQVRLWYGDIPGSPTVGWHADTPGVDRRHGGLLRCADADPAFRALMDARGGGVEPILALLRDIESRGPGRLSVTRKWKG